MRLQQMSRTFSRFGIALGLAAILPSCYGQPLATRVPGPVLLKYDFSRNTSDASRTVVVVEGTPEPVPTQGSVAVRGFREPGDFAHRNYCGAGAAQVLLSGWMTNVPDIETVARRARLNVARGIYGKDEVVAVNSFLASIVKPALGHDRYKAEHITDLATIKARIQGDIVDPQATKLFGHGVPVMVQTMTGTMPGWNHWNATHMITIFAFDFSHNDPNLDTVTYAETPSPLAGYRGPDFKTITVQQLWVAMHAYIVQAPYDPLNVIS
jgi:hypothetical protein